MGRGDQSEKRVERGRCRSAGVILLRRLNIMRRVFVGRRLMLDVVHGRMNRTQELDDGGLFCGKGA